MQPADAAARWARVWRDAWHEAEGRLDPPAEGRLDPPAEWAPGPR